MIAQLWANIYALRRCTAKFTTLHREWDNAREKRYGNL
jgi:hypothetical protein